MATTVAELMTPDVITIRARQSVRAAAKLMALHQTDYLVVVDEERVVGVVTARDLITRAYARGDQGVGLVREACTVNPLLASTDDSATDLLLRMRRRCLRRVPVVDVDGHGLVGILCDADLPILAPVPVEPLGVEVRSHGRPRIDRADGVPLPVNVVPWPSSLPPSPA